MKGIFQIIIIILFIASAIFGVLVFSGAISLGSTNNKAVGNVILWGTVSQGTMAPLLESFNDANGDFSVSYVEKSAETFDQDLLEALASGKGPDMFFLTDDLAFHYSNKILVIPYQSYALTSFKSAFAGAGEVFLTREGLLAFPMTIDPLMLYYNRSDLDSDGIVYPPATWDELSAMVPVLAKKDSAGKLLKSAVPLGDFSNITHAKDIVASLFLQAGNPIIAERDGFFHSALRSAGGQYNLGSILKFYTDFADPASSLYSWNKSFPDSVDAFSSKDATFYFGFASELRPLINRNPNQNLGVAPLPQISGAGSKVTGSRVTGLAISSASKNFTTAFTAASLMATGNFASRFATALGVPPARRDLLAVKPTDAYSPIFYNSALFAKSWLDPSPSGTDDIFRTMVDSVLSNRLDPGDAVTDAGNKLDFLLIR